MISSKRPPQFILYYLVYVFGNRNGEVWNLELQEKHCNSIIHILDKTAVARIMHDHLLNRDLEHWEDNKAEELEEDRVGEFERGLTGIITVTYSCDHGADPVDWENVDSVLAVALEIFYHHLERWIPFLIVNKVIAANPDPNNREVVKQHEYSANSLTGINNDIQKSLVFVTETNFKKSLDRVMQKPYLVNADQFERRKLAV